MNELLERLKGDFQDAESRYAYADSVANAFVSAQIKALREDRDLSQEELAELIGTKQSGVSRLERTDYSAWKIETLRRLAKAFGVRLRIGFEEFGTIGNDLGSFNLRQLAPKRFEDDPAFKDTTHFSHRTIRRRSRTSDRKHAGQRRRRASLSEIPKKPAGKEPYCNAMRATASAGNNSTMVVPLLVPSGNQSIPVNF